MHFCYNREIRLRQENFSCNNKTNYTRRHELKFISHKTTAACSPQEALMTSQCIKLLPLCVNDEHKLNEGWQSFLLLKRQVFWISPSRRVRTHEKNSGETVHRLGSIYNTKHFFVPNKEPAFAWIFGNSSVRVGTQGLFRPYLKTFDAPFLRTRLTAPGSPRMVKSQKTPEKESRVLSRNTSHAKPEGKQTA